MKRRIAIAVLILIAVTAIAVYGTQQRPFPADQQLAAEVLGVAPDKLVTRAGVVVSEQMGIEQRTRLWRLFTPADDGEVPTAEVRVDIDSGLVIWACWYTPAHVGHPGGKARFTEEQCISRAQYFARQYCPYFLGGEPEDVALRVRRQVKQYVVDWRGIAPENRILLLSVTVSTLTGNVGSYNMSVFPQPPKATMPVKITAEEAKQIVLRNLPQQVKPGTIETIGITTDSIYGPYGEPVHWIDVEGKLDIGTPPLADYCERHEVHATTGEYLSTEGRKPRKQISFGPTYIDKLDAEQIAKVKLTGEQAQTIVKEHLPADMKNPRVSIKERTAESRFAPSGEPVYVCRIAYDAEDAHGAVVEAEVIWAVHATTSELFKKSATE